MLAARCAFLQSLHTVFLLQKYKKPYVLPPPVVLLRICRRLYVLLTLVVLLHHQAIAFSIPTCHMHPETWVLGIAQELQWQLLVSPVLLLPKLMGIHSCRAFANPLLS